MEDSHKDAHQKKTTSAVLAHIKNHWFPYLLAGFFLFLAAYSAFQNSILKSKVAAEKIQIHQQFEAISNDRLRLTAKTLSWAVRSAMQRNNFDQVQEYFQEFIREEKVGTVALADNQGVIKVCTNMKFESQPIQSLFKIDSISMDNSIKILPWQSEQLVVTPIMALNEQLGTLYWTFQTDSLGVQ